MENIKVVDLSSELQNEQQKLKSELQKHDEKNKIMHNAADAFNSCVKDLIMDGESLIAYIDSRDLNAVLDGMYKDMERLREQINKKDTDTYIEDMQCPIIDLGIDCVCLFERLNKDIQKAKELEKQEMEKQQELEDLENAKSIFEMLKMEVLKSGCGFDEWTISIYIKDMLEYARKYKVDLGIKEDN